MLDMVVYVKGINQSNETCTILDIRWFNRKGLDINIEDTVEISNQDFDKWYEWKGQVK